jgi:two-component system NtrC family sensor kinase
MKNKVIDILQKTELFAPLSADLIERMVEESETANYPTGSVIIKKGDDGDCLYIITKGSVKIHDDEQIVAEIKSGDIVGELALLDKGPRSMTVTTQEDTDFLLINRESFFRLLKDRPDMVEKMIGLLTQRLRNQNFKLVESLLHREEELSALVRERTKDLHDRNLELKEALDKLKSAQQQLIMSEKMASLVQLTAGIAHEIQNPLNFVINFSSLTLELMDELVAVQDPAERGRLMEELTLNIKKIQQHGIRADATIKSMLLHSRTGSGEKQLADVSDQIAEIMRLSYQGFRTIQPTFHGRLEFKKDETLPSVFLILQEFNRVLLNIFNNAFYSMHQKKMNLEKSGQFDYEPVLSIDTRLQDGYIDIHIKDNGEGIPSDIRDKVFNPFFTTKPPGIGTGLGLSLSYDIITKAHNGKLSVTSKVNEGSEFVISIPV